MFRISKSVSPVQMSSTNSTIWKTDLRKDGLDLVRDEDILDQGCNETRFPSSFIPGNDYANCFGGAHDELGQYLYKR